MACTYFVYGSGPIASVKLDASATATIKQYSGGIQKSFQDVTHRSILEVAMGFFQYIANPELTNPKGYPTLQPAELVLDNQQNVAKCNKDWVDNLRVAMYNFILQDTCPTTAELLEISRTWTTTVTNKQRPSLEECLSVDDGRTTVAANTGLCPEIEKLKTILTVCSEGMYDGQSCLDTWSLFWKYNGRQSNIMETWAPSITKHFPKDRVKVCVCVVCVCVFGETFDSSFVVCFCPTPRWIEVRFFRFQH